MISTLRQIRAGVTSARSTTTRRRPSCAFWRRSFRRTPRTAPLGARRFRAGWKRGADCILAAQIAANGKRTVWCQQHDAVTLQPTSARNYEMPAATSSESGTMVLFLMQLPDPDSNVVAAVHAACAWFEKTKIEGQAFRVVGTESRKLVDAPGSGPIWARYYEI